MMLRSRTAVAELVAGAVLATFTASCGGVTPPTGPSSTEAASAWTAGGPATESAVSAADLGSCLRASTASCFAAISPRVTTQDRSGASLLEAPRNLSAEVVGALVRLTWSAPSGGLRGGAVNPD